MAPKKPINSYHSSHVPATSVCAASIASPSRATCDAELASSVPVARTASGVTAEDGDEDDDVEEEEEEEEDDGSKEWHMARRPSHSMHSRSTNSMVARF